MIDLGDTKVIEILTHLAKQVSEQQFNDRIEKVAMEALFENENAVAHIFLDEAIAINQTILVGLLLLLKKSYQIRRKQEIKEAGNEK